MKENNFIGNVDVPIFITGAGPIVITNNLLAIFLSYRVADYEYKSTSQKHTASIPLLSTQNT